MRAATQHAATVVILRLTHPPITSGWEVNQTSGISAKGMPKHMLIVACELQLRLVEEPYLASTHGSSYIDYATRTGRFLSGLGRLTARNQPLLGGSE
jgi:protein-S-isoprenylcysteine O-methyltransferase Ste14